MYKLHKSLSSIIHGFALFGGSNYPSLCFGENYFVVFSSVETFVRTVNKLPTVCQLPPHFLSTRISKSLQTLLSRSSVALVVEIQLRVHQ